MVVSDDHKTPKRDSIDQTCSLVIEETNMTPEVQSVFSIEIYGGGP